MRLVLLSLFAFAAFAQTSSDPTNGHLIAEPTLADYDHAQRTPGFSQVVDIVDTNGKSLGY